MIKVAIIGSGPAGLACAQTLSSAGVSVTVFEELKEFGGMLAYGIPEFRMPLKNIRERIQGLKEKRLEFKNKKIISAKRLLKKFEGQFDYVVLAIGAGSGNTAGFEGENSKNVIDALDFLLKDKLENKKLLVGGETVAVIGGGNSAVDAARVAVRQGAKTKILYRRTAKEMPALACEIDGAKKDGVEFEYLVAPKKYIPTEKNPVLVCSKMILSEKDSSGRAKPVDSGEENKMSFDKIIVAAGQKNDYSWLQKDGIKTNEKIVLVNSANETSLENVYACGDCVTGPKTIGEATKTGIKTANEILKKEKT